MLSGNNVVCGTATSGTGTLTLAACPTAVGGMDFDVWARGALGQGNSAAVHISYTIIEFTDSTFASPKQRESGIGILTLGASAGVANCTLTRSYPTEVQTGLNTQPATVAVGAPAQYSGATGKPASAAPMTIGTPANVLVMLSDEQAESIGALRASAAYSGLVSGGPQYEALATFAQYGTYGLTSGRALFSPMFCHFSDLIYSMSVFISGAVSTPTSSSLQLALYDIWDSADSQGVEHGLPGQILALFPTISTPNPLGTSTLYWATLTKPIFLRAGFYAGAMLPIWSGGSGTPTVAAMNALAGMSFGTTYNGQNPGAIIGVGGLAALANDPFAGVAAWNFQPDNTPAQIRFFLRNW